MRVVLDTNVIVKAFRSPRGASAGVLNGGAEAIVTFERGTFNAAARSFGIAVVTPAEMLNRLGR